MEKSVSAKIRSALAEGLMRKLSVPVSSDEIKLPARGADAAWAGAIRLKLDADALASSLNAELPCFPPLFGVQPVKAVSQRNGWLLFTLNSSLFDAALDADARPLPPERPDDSALRMKLFMLARHDPKELPDDPALRRAILLLWAAEESPSLARIEKAAASLLEAPFSIPPAERPAYIRRLGAPARLALDADTRFRKPSNN